MLHGASLARHINRIDLWWRCPGADCLTDTVFYVEWKLGRVTLDLHLLDSLPIFLDNDQERNDDIVRSQNDCYQVVCRLFEASHGNVIGSGRTALVSTLPFTHHSPLDTLEFVHQPSMLKEVVRYCSEPRSSSQ